MAGREAGLRWRSTVVDGRPARYGIAGVLSPRSLIRVVPVVAADAITNAVQNPHALWAVGRLARDANLEAEPTVPGEQPARAPSCRTSPPAGRR